MAGDSPTASSELEEVGAAHEAAGAAELEPTGAEAAGGGGGGGSGGAADEPSPRSPAGGFIPAIKRQEGTTFDLQAWPSELGGHFFTTTLDGGASEPAPAQPAWRRAWQRISGAASVAAGAVAALMPLRRPWQRRGSKELSQALANRTRSLEVLQAAGRQQSAVYLPRKQPPGAPRAAAGRQSAALRWRRAVQAVSDAREAAACLDLLADRLAPADDRLHAAVRLTVRLQRYGRQERLGAALQARHGGARLRPASYLMQELFITGESLFSFLTPPRMGAHRPYFTPLLVAVLCITYFFMAGQYGQYQAVTSSTAVACLQAGERSGAAPAWGPGAMVRWLSPRAGPAWCFGAPGPGRFDGQYLIDWGARWAPVMRSSPQRWLTSVLLHQSFGHLLSNALVLLAFGWQLEAKHGTWRLALLALAAALGGGLLRRAAVTEAPCVAVVGASGVVFGLAGATVADMGTNFETLRRPLLRTALLLAFLIFFAVTVGNTATGTSHMSHVGGFLAGLGAGLAALPNLHRTRCEAAATALGAAGAVAMFVALPCLFYLRVLPGLTC